MTVCCRSRLNAYRTLNCVARPGRAAHELGALLVSSPHGDPAAAAPLLRDALAGRAAALGEGHPDTLASANDLGVLLENSARQLDGERTPDPAALARLYAEAADMRALKEGAEGEAVVRCRRRAAELLERERAARAMVAR